MGKSSMSLLREGLVHKTILETTEFAYCCDVNIDFDPSYVSFVLK